MLVVDDEPDARELLTARARASRRARGHGARACAEALAASSASGFDVIVSDIGMPGADGYELVGRLRALDHARARDAGAWRSPASPAPKTAPAPPRAGFDAHMSKPVDPVALVDALERARRDAARRRPSDATRIRLRRTVEPGS